jgi:hypothetical protein
MKKAILLIAAFVVIFSSVASAQNSTNGEIRGFVTDEQGAAVVDAKVVITNTDTGLMRELMTDERGRYRAILLPLGSYSVQVEKGSFKKWEQKGIRLQVGDALSINVTLEIGEFENVVTITGDAPVIETTNTAVSAVVGEEFIENLPINGRDYRDFVLLTPSAGYSSRNGVTLGGSRGVQTNLTVDGFDSNSAFFGEQVNGEIDPTFTISLESIKEFRVLTSGFSAEFGRSNGTLMTMVTKSGTNEFRGSGFFFYQNEGMVADQLIATNFGEDSEYVEQEEFKRNQFGGSLGGPIIKDKAFFFVSADVQRLDIPRSVRFDITDAQRAQYPSIAAQETEYTETNDVNAFLAKVDFQLSDNHNLSARWSYTEADQQNGIGYFSTNAPSTQGNENMTYNVFSGTLTSFFGDNMINELRVQYAMEDMTRDRVNDDDLPQHQQGGYDFVFGSTYFLPITNDMERFQVTDNLNILMGDHDIKVGFDYNRTKTEQVFIGYWSGRLYYDTLEDYINGNPYRARQRIPLGGRDIDASGRWPFVGQTLAVYVQDKWQPTDRMTIDAGLRWEAVYTDDPGTEYGNPQIPGNTELYDDTNNFAPRAGIAYDVFGDGKTVIRAAAGLFYAVTPHLLYVQHFMENGVVSVVQQFGDNIPNPYNYQEVIARFQAGSYTGLDVATFDPDFEEAETWRFNFGIERELMPGTSLSVDFLYADGSKNQRRWDKNLNILTGQTDARGEQLYSTRNRPNPLFGRYSETVSIGEMEYIAITGLLKSRIGRDLNAQVSYTWSRDKDDDSNERGYSDINVTDYLDPSKDFSYSDRDRTHRFVGSLLYRAPFDINVSGILTLQSGRRYSAVWGTDLNGDGQYNDRAEPGSGGTVYSERNDYETEMYKNLDIRISKAFVIDRFRIEGIFEAFNVLNWETITSEQSTARYSSFGLPSGYQTSRRLQLGGRITF